MIEYLLIKLIKDTITEIQLLIEILHSRPLSESIFILFHRDSIAWILREQVLSVIHLSSTKKLAKVLKSTVIISYLIKGSCTPEGSLVSSIG